LDKVIYVGTAPGNHPPDKSPTIKRITKWSDQAGLKEWTWTNLIDFKSSKLKLKKEKVIAFPDYLPKEFGPVEVDFDIKRIEGYKVIALGNLVAKYFEIKNIEHLKVPHPSGLNRMWNDPELEPKVIEEIRGFTNS
jgi:hypothetical protein